MFDHALVAIDGREGGRDALALAGALQPEGQITLATVYQPQPYVWRGAGPAYEAQDRDQAQVLLSEERTRAGVDARLCAIASAPVAAGLHKLARALAADVLVVGSCRRGKLGQIMLGNDTQATLYQAPCPVAIATKGFAEDPRPANRIGVAYDGSAESEHALGFTRQLARELAATLVVFKAVSVPAKVIMAGGASVGMSTDELVDETQEELEVITGEESLAAYGAPVDELTRFSATVDLLVIGSRDYGRLGRALHGSTASRLADLSTCPLLVLTRGARAGGSTRGALS